MADMLVKLYDLPDITPYIDRVEKQGIRIIRPISGNKGKIVDFVSKNFNTNWANECDVAFSSFPTPLFIAEKNGEILGFVCYDVVAPNFFGPTGVDKSQRGNGIGAALLLKALYAQKEQGYGYSIIGWADGGLNFYKQTVGAIEIENSFPGIYKNLIGE